MCGRARAASAFASSRGLSLFLIVLLVRSMAAAAPHCLMHRVWNNNFFEYFMGNYIPPVTTPDQLYTSDAGGIISVNRLRARNRGFRQRNVTELPYFSLMEFGGGPAKYAMRCPPSSTSRHKDSRSDHHQEHAGPDGRADYDPMTGALEHQGAVMVPPSATTGPINIRKCSEAPVGPEDSYIMLWQQLNVTDGSQTVQFKLTHNPHGGEELCLTAVHDSGPTFNDELAVHPCNASSNFQRWRWAEGQQLMSAMTRTEKDSVWAGRSGRCNGPVECCLQVNGDKAEDGRVLQGGICGHDSLGWKLVPQLSGAVTIEGQSFASGYCIAYSYRMPQPPPRPPPPPPPPPPPSDPVAWHHPNEYLANKSLEAAVLRNDKGQCVNSPGWHESFIMDCAEPHYLQLLQEEARRHVTMLGDDFSGVSCDRGWPQLFNPNADDGVSFCDQGHDGGKCRSLLFSQQEASKAVFGDIFHKAGKMVSYVSAIADTDNAINRDSVQSRSPCYLTLVCPVPSAPLFVAM